MGSSTSDENYKYIQLVPDNLDIYSPEQIEAHYRANNNNLTDEELYYLYQYYREEYGDEYLDVMGADFSDGMADYFEDNVSRVENSPELQLRAKYRAAQTPEELAQLINENIETFTLDDINVMNSALLHELKGLPLPRSLAYMEGLETYGDFLAYWVNGGREEFDNQLKQTNSVKDDLHNSQGAFSMGFNTDVTAFAISLINLASAIETCTMMDKNIKSGNLDLNCDIVPRVYVHFPNMIRLDYDGFRKTIDPLMKEALDESTEAFDTLDIIKRNLMNVDDDFKSQFNDVFIACMNQFLFGHEKGKFFFTSEAMLKLTRDALSYGGYTDEQKALLKDIIEHSESAQMTGIQALINGTGVFVCSFIGGFVGVVEEIMDGAFGAIALGMGAVGLDDAASAVYKFVQTDWSGELKNELYELSGISQYFVTENAVGQIAARGGDMAGQAVADAVILMLPGSKTAAIIKATRSAGRTLESGLQGVDVTDPDQRVVAVGQAAWTFAFDYAIGSYASKGRAALDEYVKNYGDIILASAGGGVINAGQAAASDLNQIVLGNKDPGDLVEDIIMGGVSGFSSSFLKYTGITNSNGYKAFKKYYGYANNAAKVATGQGINDVEIAHYGDSESSGDSYGGYSDYGDVPSSPADATLYDTNNVGSTTLRDMGVDLPMHGFSSTDEFEIYVFSDDTYGGYSDYGDVPEGTTSVNYQYNSSAYQNYGGNYSNAVSPSGEVYDYTIPDSPAPTPTGKKPPKPDENLTVGEGLSAIGL